MRSAKRTQTYWRAGCIGAAAGGGGRRGRAIGSPGHASDVAGDAVAAAAASPQQATRPDPTPYTPHHFNYPNLHVKVFNLRFASKLFSN